MADLSHHVLYDSALDIPAAWYSMNSEYPREICKSGEQHAAEKKKKQSVA
jgi:hypothetical protein